MQPEGFMVLPAESGFFRPMATGQELSRGGKLIRLVPVVLLCGVIGGPVIFILFSLIGSGHLPAIRSGSGLVRLLTTSAGLGGLMSISFFVTCGLPAMFLYPALRHYPRAIYLTLVVLIAFAGGLLGFAVPSYLMLYFFGLRFISEDSLRQFLVVDGALGVAIALIVAAFEKLRAEVRRTERLLYESKFNEHLLAERNTNAQLKVLQAQINPHFLFNTLSSIATLSTIDGVRAKEMIISLADVYRHILRCSTSNLVPIEEEMEMVRSYLSIEAVRFRDRLDVEIDTSPLGNVMVPGLVLQPIVENAIKHGIARNLRGGSISIRFERDDRDLTIAVCNTSESPCDLSPAKLFVEGHALKNVNDRLKMVYGDAYELTITHDAVKVCATLKVPLAVKAVS
jgi:sensor histidine kinase YesM